MGERTSYEPGTPCWVDLSTPDLDGALRFYGGLFGWEFEDAGEEAGHYHQALVRGKRVAGLGPAQEGAPPAAYWMTYLCGTDADEHASAIKDAGGEVEFGPIDILGQGRMVVGQDPTGAMFGIWEPQEHKGAQLVNENATLTWNELLTRDVQRAARFHGALFGFAFESLPATEASVYQVLKLGDRFVGGIGTLPEGTPADVPPYWLTYFQLDDVDAGFERARELGGEVLGDPIDSPYGRFASVRDPQGGVFALIRAASPAS
jgi:predicted enzyme related to lactoylglutathione lyase